MLLSDGAFGSITKVRHEVIIEGTLAANPAAPGVEWLEFEFVCKPGNVTRAPCLITPYHYRLDWLMWFAAFGSYQQHPWLLHLTAQLLSDDRGPLAATLLAADGDPFAARELERPRFIRAQHYEYHYTTPEEAGVSWSSPWPRIWWKRRLVGEYFPPVSLDNPSLRKFIEGNGWAMPRRLGGK